MTACRQEKPDPVRPVGAVVEIKAPLGLPPVPIPADNPPTAETIELGRRLFNEVQLSADNTISCAVCHNPAIGFGDGKRVSTGVGGKTGTRNAPTVLNAAYYPSQFWDGRAATLEEQAAGPIANPIEMNLPHDAAVEKLNAAGYGPLFEKAFGPGPVTMEKVQMAIASFERTVLSANSPFDRYQFGGDRKAMSASAIRGLAIFKDKNKGNCAVCHTIEENHALFTDGKFHNLGVGLNAQGELTGLGRFEQTKLEADKGAFKTATLRNIAQTAPYMHDGSQRTLREVVDFYVGGGNSNPYLDKEIRELKLSGQERADLVAFLEALTGEPPPVNSR
ncbi:MAG: cytochrome c peroxidase [Bryobacteraceae bacterium]|nr:cytochrome c peroxidase [Bryobacteraceae bacterium]